MVLRVRVRVRVRISPVSMVSRVSRKCRVGLELELELGLLF